MVAYKAAQAAGFIRNPSQDCVAALVYGPDASLVAERARELTRALAGQHDPAAEVLRLDDRDLAENPDLVAVELQTRSLFGEQRIIHLKGERRLETSRLKELFDGEVDARLIVEAGNLKPTSPLRKLFEAGKQLAALPCYSDPARDMAPLIDTELQQANVTISRDARAYLLAKLGTNTSVARSECAKLATYVGLGKEISTDDIDAVVGNVSDGMADTLAAAIAEGRLTLALAQFDAMVAAGQSPYAALSALSRHFQRLHQVCAAIEAGRPAKSAVAGFRPPLHFKLQDSLIANARKWSEAGAAHVLRQVNAAVQATRLSPRLETELTERLMLGIKPR